MKLTIEQRIALAEKRVELRSEELQHAAMYGPSSPYHEGAWRRWRRSKMRLHKLRKARERMMG